MSKSIGAAKRLHLDSRARRPSTRLCLSRRRAMRRRRRRVAELRTHPGRNRRRERCEARLLRFRSPAYRRLQFNEHATGDGEIILKNAGKLGFEASSRRRRPVCTAKPQSMAQGRIAQPARVRGSWLVRPGRIAASSRGAAAFEGVALDSCRRPSAPICPRSSLPARGLFLSNMSLLSTDQLLALYGFGPSSGPPSHLNGVISSDDFLPLLGGRTPSQLGVAQWRNLGFW
jgi:hypothetical protein